MNLIARALSALVFIAAAGSANATSNSELLPTEVFIIEQAAKAPKRKGGGSSTIGTDAYDVRTQTGWFYGSKPIVTCYNRLESFGVSDSQAAKALANSVERWQKYFTTKQIAKSGGEQSPNVNFKLTGKCKGEEDLVVFFGTGPIFGGLGDLKAVQRLNYPVAYVNKTHMSRDMKWGKGYLRIVASGYYGKDVENAFPDWRKKNSLEAVLTHELGHVLGFSHAPQTIMRAELVDQVFSDNEKPQGLDIDGAQELVSCALCAESFALAKSAVGFPFFTGLGLKPNAPLRLLRNESRFELSDGKTKIPLTETSRTELEGNQNLWTNFSEPLNNSSRTFNLYGSIATAAGKTPVILEYNPGNNGQVIMRTTEAGEIREIGRFIRE